MTLATIQIVRLVEALPDAFGIMRREAAAEGYRFLDTLEQEWGEGRYDGRDDRYASFAAFAEGELAAIGAVTPDPYDAAPDLARLRHVYVRPSRRGGGVGRILAAALVQQGLASAPRLSLNAADERAIAFWDALGFRRDPGGTRRTHLLTREG